MRIISTAPLRDPIESKLGASNDKESLEQLQTLFSEPQSGLFIIDLPTGSGRTTRLNFIEHGILNYSEAQISKGHGKSSTSAKCVIRISCTSKPREVDWRTYLVGSIHASAVRNKLAESLVSIIRTVPKLDAKGKLLANTIWPDIKRERTELGEMVMLAPWKYGMTPDILISQLVKKNKHTQWIILIDNFDFLETNDKNDLCRELIAFQEQLEYVVAFIATDLYKDDDIPDIPLSGGEGPPLNRYWRDVLKSRGMELANIYGSCSIATGNLFKHHLKAAGVVINQRLENKIQECFGTDLRAANRFVNRMHQFPPEKLLVSNPKIESNSVGDNDWKRLEKRKKKLLMILTSELEPEARNDICDSSKKNNLAAHQQTIQFQDTTFLDKETYRKTHYSRVAATLLLENTCGNLISRIRKGDDRLLCSLLAWSLRGQKAPEDFYFKDANRQVRNEYEKIRPQINEAIEILRTENGYIEPYYSIDQMKPYFLFDFSAALKFERTPQTSSAAVLYWHARQCYEEYLRISQYIFEPDSPLLKPSLLTNFSLLFDSAKQLTTKAIEELGEYTEIAKHVHELDQHIKLHHQKNKFDEVLKLTENRMPDSLRVRDKSIETYDKKNEVKKHPSSGKSNRSEAGFDLIEDLVIGDNPDYLQYIDREYLKPRILANCVLLAGQLLLDENKSKENTAFLNKFRLNTVSIKEEIDRKKMQFEERRNALQKRKENNELFTLFISYRYNPRDELLSDMLISALRKKAREKRVTNLKIYQDRERLYAGHDWREALWKHLNNSHSYLLLCSKEYMAERPDIETANIYNQTTKVKADNWTWAEAAYARSASHTRFAPIFWVPVLSNAEKETDPNTTLPNTFRWLSKHQRGEPIVLPTNEYAKEQIVLNEQNKEQSGLNKRAQYQGRISHLLSYVKSLFGAQYDANQSNVNLDLTKEMYRYELVSEICDSHDSVYKQLESNMENTAEFILNGLLKDNFISIERASAGD